MDVSDFRFSIFDFFQILETKNVRSGRKMGTFHQKMAKNLAKNKKWKIRRPQIRNTPKIHNVLKN